MPKPEARSPEPKLEDTRPAPPAVGTASSQYNLNRKDGFVSTPQLGRNDPCHCGSGKKYKQCHLAADEAAAREARAKAVAEAPEPVAEAVEVAAAPKHTKPQAYQPWKKSATNTQGFQRMSTPRKVGGS